ncbi:MAG TPA: RluA family pseudouridine synthase, partial [Polyangiales bacterium]
LADAESPNATATLRRMDARVLRTTLIAPVPEQCITVDRDGLQLSRVVREAAGEGLSWNKARELCTSGRVKLNGRPITDPATRIASGDQVSFDRTAPRARKGVLPAERIVHLDGDVVVVNKPAGIMSVPFEDEKDTLIDITRAALRAQQKRSGFDPELGIVHRIDIDTTGLLVFTRNLEAKRQLQQQFRVHSVHRRYLALVHGNLVGRTFDSVLIRDRGDGLRGSFGVFRAPRGKPPADAQRAITHARVLERFEQGATLVECALETGRQHQIRIHLSEAGCPLLGERVYIRDYQGPRIEAARPMLHAAELGFVHPRTGRQLSFRIEPPEDFARLLAGFTPLGGRGAR